MEFCYGKLDFKLFKDLLINHFYKYKRFFFSISYHSRRGIYKTSFFEFIEIDIELKNIANTLSDN